MTTLDKLVATLREIHKLACERSHDGSQDDAQLEGIIIEVTKSLALASHILDTETT